MRRNEAPKTLAWGEEEGTVMRRSITMMALSLSAGLLLSIGAVPSASALGNGVAQCGRDNPFAGYSTATAGGATWQSADGACGQVGVRLFYVTYRGSLTYYTAWRWGTRTVATPHPGNTVLGGNHRVTSAGLIYTSQFST